MVGASDFDAADLAAQVQGLKPRSPGRGGRNRPDFESRILWIGAVGHWTRPLGM